MKPFSTWTSPWERCCFDVTGLSYAAIAATVIGAGVSAASATGAIGPAKPEVPDLPKIAKPPDRASPEVLDARRRALLAETGGGAGANYLTAGRDLGAAPVAQKYLTGQ